MIAKQQLKELRGHISWKKDEMIEQDLIISRALIALYNNEHIRNTLVFRGGTALNKLYLKPPQRYSEDIDFVQLKTAPIGPTLRAISQVMDPWLTIHKTKITRRGVKIFYSFDNVQGVQSKLKIEINTREHFQVEPLQKMPFFLQSSWFSGNTTITVYSLEEMMATKLRVLYQRRKGRDLFDVWYVFSNKMVNYKKVIDIFRQYAQYNKETISSRGFLQNMKEKYENEDFRYDMDSLLPSGKEWDFEAAFKYVKDHILQMGVNGLFFYPEYITSCLSFLKIIPLATSIAS